MVTDLGGLDSIIDAKDEKLFVEPTQGQKENLSSIMGRKKVRNFVNTNLMNYHSR